MSKVAEKRLPELPPHTSDTRHSSRHIKLSEVFDVYREHGHINPSEFREEPMSRSDCLIVPQGAVQPFHLDFSKQAPKWAPYESIVPAASSSVGRSSHNGTYSYDQVFSPYKLIIAERDNPIRAVLTSEPIYPTRAKLGILRSGIRLWLAYAAVAVLNSVYGQSAYRTLSGKTSSPDGLDMDGLKSIPIARRDFEFSELSAVAGLVHQVNALWTARAECIPQLTGVVKNENGLLTEASKHFDRVFDQQIEGVSERLNESITMLLGYSEGEEALHQSSGKPLPLQLQMYELTLPAPPPPPPVRLLSSDDRQLLETPPSRITNHINRDLLQVLPMLDFWEENINTLPARDAWREECGSLAA